MSNTHLHKADRKWVKTFDLDNLPLKLRLWYARINFHRGEMKRKRKDLIDKIALRELKNIDL
jgi:hypothetical protein